VKAEVTLHPVDVLLVGYDLEMGRLHHGLELADLVGGAEQVGGPSGS